MAAMNHFATNHNATMSRLTLLWSLLLCFSRVFSAENGVFSKSNGEYNFSDDIEKAILGEYNVNKQDSYNNEDGARVADRLKTSQFSSVKNAAVGGANGENFAIEGSFDKGSKTTGYHNVHHKEEYKKNREFYDVAHKAGSFRRYGDFGAVLLAAAKGTKKNESVDGDSLRQSFGNRAKNGSGSLYGKLKKYGAGNGQYYVGNVKLLDILNIDQN